MPDLDGRAASGVGRRSFLNWLLGGGLLGLAGSILYPVINFVFPPEIPEGTVSSVVAAKTDELAPNTGKIFKFGSRPGILVRAPDGEYRAFSAVCTHLQCTVQYRPDRNQIWCACHNGQFDLQGRVVAGPPPQPLVEYRVTVRGDDVLVSVS